MDCGKYFALIINNPSVIKPIYLAVQHGSGVVNCNCEL